MCLLSADLLGVEIIQPPVQEQQAQPVAPIQTNTPNINAREIALMKQIKEKWDATNKLTSPQFIDLCMKNGLPRDRATELFVNEYE